MEPCAFCAIAAGRIPAHLVLDEGPIVAFLDRTPLFPGHVLVAPRAHRDTFLDVPAEELAPLFATAQRVARAVQSATGADGTFVAMNNVVSQSVPHLHVHVVPRRRKDGLKGFFWPRHRYGSDAEMADMAERIRAVL